MFSRRKEKGKAIIYIAECTGCGNCVGRCRHKAIELVSLEGRRYARLKNDNACTGCGNCVKVCENDAIQIRNSQFIIHNS